MYHGGGNNDHGYTKYQQSSCQTTVADDDYFRDTFQPRAHQDHTKYPAYGGWQTSPNEDYYQVVRTETVKTVEPPMFPHLNTLVDETVRVEEKNSFRRPGKHVPKGHEQVYSSIYRPDKHVPQAHEQVYTSIQHVPQAHEQVYTSIQHVPQAHEQVYTSIHRPEHHVPMAHEQVYTSIRRPEQHVPMAHEPVYTSIRRPEQHVPKAKEQVHVKKHVHFVQGGKEGKQETTYDENVDMEADDFIKRKHKKFDLSKLLSMRAH